MNEKPLVMCLTNTVAAEFTANALLAVGAKPAMVEEPSEAAELAAVADAVLINLGTVHPRQAEAMRAAVCHLGTDPERSAAAPWVLDPVACHLLTYRGRLAAELVARRPTLIRGNHAEIDFLRKNVPETGTVPVLSTGEVDRLFAPCSSSVHVSAHTEPSALIAGGVPMLQSVTATGCAQGAICAALLGRGQSPQEAAENASRMMKRAGEIAWERAKAPGSFRTALIDALYGLSHADVP